MRQKLHNQRKRDRAVRPKIAAVTVPFALSPLRTFLILIHGGRRQQEVQLQAWRMRLLRLP